MISIPLHLSASSFAPIMCANLALWRENIAQNILSEARDLHTDLFSAATAAQSCSVFEMKTLLESSACFVSMRYTSFTFFAVISDFAGFGASVSEVKGQN